MKYTVSFLGCFGILVVGGGVFLVSLLVSNHQPEPRVYFAPPVRSSFPFEAIDTMKYSRDPSREKLKDDSFDQIIEAQIGSIAATGATHVAIATPYDEEFVPILKRWVETARRHHLKVWFRGNWSGWEGWFDYPSITRAEHIEKTKQFISAHPDIFEDGDAFSSCPECENGGPGDPRQTGDVSGHRQFLIGEYDMMQESFRAIGKSVRVNLFSMNGDVAKLVMDQPTTRALGGVVTIDHYVKDPEQLVRDIDELAQQSGGKIVLGEFGAPIPDIHGVMTEEQQAAWIDKALGLLIHNTHVAGVSYWVGTGGSTELWDSKGTPRQAVEVLHKYYHPEAIYGTVRDERDNPLQGATIRYGDTEEMKTDKEGRFAKVFVPDAPSQITVSLLGYHSKVIDILSGDEEELKVVLETEHKSVWRRLGELVREPF